MNDMCTDNRFELIERFKKKLIESTNIETSPEEMKAIDNLLFRFWQMGWLDIIDRMLLVKESAKTLMHSVGNSVSAKAFRNAGRFIQNAIDGEAPEFEKIPSAQPEPLTDKEQRIFLAAKDHKTCGLECLRCKQTYDYSWDTMNEISYTMYSYCPDCIRKGIQLLRSQDN